MYLSLKQSEKKPQNLCAIGMSKRVNSPQQM